MIKGYCFGLMYIFLVAASSIWLSGLGKNVPIPILLFYTSLTSITFFNIVNYKTLKNNYLSIFKHKADWAYMSLSLVFIWYCTYYGTTNSSAEFFITSTFLTTACISAIKEKNNIKTMACIISLCITYYCSNKSSVLTLFTSIIAGIAGYIYYSTSYSFSKKTNMGVLAILSIRFYFVLIFAFMFIISTDTMPSLAISSQQAVVFILFALANMIIPAFLSQSCLHAIGVTRFSFLNTLIPTLTFIIEAGIKGIWHPGMLFACLLATVTLNWNYLERLSKSFYRPPAASIKEPVM